MILENYLEQHKGIKKQVEVVKKLSQDNNLCSNASQIGTEISRLAGVIRIHLSSEDKFMYPKLVNSEDDMIRKKAALYQEEMGNLMEVFTIFKEKYNTKQKILENSSSFQKDLKEIVAQLSKRMEKEEKELYKFL